MFWRTGDDKHNGNAVRWVRFYKYPKGFVTMNFQVDTMLASKALATVKAEPGGRRKLQISLKTCSGQHIVISL